MLNEWSGPSAAVKFSTYSRVLCYLRHGAYLSSDLNTQYKSRHVPSSDISVHVGKQGQTRAAVEADNGGGFWVRVAPHQVGPRLCQMKADASATADGHVQHGRAGIHEHGPRFQHHHGSCAENSHTRVFQHKKEYLLSSGDVFSA